MSWLFNIFKRLFLEYERAPEPTLEIVPFVPFFDSEGWATDSRVVKVPSRKSWCYSKLSTKSGLPDGITMHFTSTAAGTAMNMAVRRRDHDRKEFEPKPPGSWHFTAAQNGVIIQQLSLQRGAFHAGSKTAIKLPIGWANFVTCGIELEGFGDAFSEAQIESLCWLYRGIVTHCGIKRENAMFEHSKIDSGRKTDPGELFMSRYSQRVLDYAFGSIGPVIA